MEHAVPGTGRRAQGLGLATAARRAVTAVRPATTAAPGANLASAHVAAVPATSRPTASVVVTARRVRGRPLEPAVQPVAFAVTRLTTVVLGVNPALAPVAAARVTFRPTASVAATARRVLARPLVPAVRPVAFAVAQLLTAVPVVRAALGLAAAVLAGSLLTGHAGQRTGRPALARPSATVVRVEGFVGKRRTTADRDGECRGIPSVLFRPWSRAQY